MSQTAMYHYGNDNKYMQNLYSEQVILKVLNANDNNNNNTIAIDNNNGNIYTGAKRHFLICNSCFWCVSLYLDSRTVKCPTCNSYSNLESIPLSKNESFKFDYHSTTGIALEFLQH